jgi:DNA repair protein RadC
MYALRQLPAASRPRERLDRMGPEGLADWELIALLLGEGSRGHDVVAVAWSVSERFGTLEALATAAPEELASIAGVGPAKAARLAAALELGRRLLRPDSSRRRRVRCADDVFRGFRGTVIGLTRENFWALALGSRHQVIRELHIAEGSPSSVEVHPREVFRPLVQAGASATLLVHNHPSGDPTPSVDDRTLTRRLVESGRLMGIPVLDHVIVTPHGFTSLSELEPDLVDGSAAAR